MSSVNDAFAVGWISALDVELASAIAMLDENDHNTYTFGRIGQHKIVAAGLPTGSTGNNPALHAATHLSRSFPSVKCILLVGIGGGVSSISEDPAKDMRLGDVVVSTLNGSHGGVVQYDFGTSIYVENDENDGDIVRTQSFIRKGCLDKPPLAFRTALARLRADAKINGPQFTRHFVAMLDQKPFMRAEYKRPMSDKLYKAGYIHSSDDNCGNCSASTLVDRRPRQRAEPTVHYGTIGSANQVVRDANMRDRLFKTEGIICFEMEAAGLMDLGCLVIRGVSDYCDSHKNDDWKGYASAIAAAYTKEVLMTLPPEDVEEYETPSSIIAAR